MVLMEVTGGKYQGTTNIKELKSVFFSIKNKKFIKPIATKGNSVSGHYIYKLLPGNYIMFNYNYWTKRDPSVILEITLVRLDPQDPEGKTYNIETKKNVVLRYDRKEERLEILKDYPKVLGVTEDFVKAVPGYHTGAGVRNLSTKFYDEETVKELLEFIDKHNGDTLYHEPEIE